MLCGIFAVGKTGENLCKYCSPFWSSTFKKEEFSQEHVQKGEGEVEVSFYEGRLQWPTYLVHLKSRTSDLFITNKEKIQDRERTIYDKG